MRLINNLVNVNLTFPAVQRLQFQKLGGKVKLSDVDIRHMADYNVIGNERYRRVETRGR